MTEFFNRFNKVWASRGLLDNPSDTQAETGWIYLGQAPPTVEQFNSTAQWLDEKDNWLYGQIDTVINRAGLVSIPEDITTLYEALLRMGGAYVRKIGDTMTGALNMSGNAIGVRWDAPGALLYGPWYNNQIAFGWNGSGIRVRIDGTDVGTLELNSISGNYVKKSGDTMSGNLDIYAGLAANWIYSRGDLSAAGNIAASGNVSGYAGNFTQNVTGGFIWSAGNIQATNRLLAFDIVTTNAYFSTTYPAYPNASSFYLTSDGTTHTTNYHPGYGWQFSAADGWLRYIGASAVRFQIEPYGNVHANDYYGANAYLYGAQMSGGISFVGNGSLGAIWAYGDSGVFRLVGSYPNYQQLGVKSWANLLSYNTQYQPDGGGAWSCEIGGRTGQAGDCVATGYPGWSDASLKHNIKPFTPGLAAILKIDPVSFEFTEEAKLAPGVRHGVTAQDVMKVLPEAVVTVKRYLTEASTLNLEEPTEVLAVESSTILYACVNAIKELADRLATLENE